MSESLDSVYLQNYPSIEIIVVDDGSEDDTKHIVDKYREVRYVHQTNQGLSSARNTGIRNSRGEFLVFLDADDRLLPGAIVTNLSYLVQNETLAFVSGAHEKMFNCNVKIEDILQDVKSNHFFHLLYGNYIAMHGAVMFRRRIFDEFLYDTSLKACEDYDIYLKIARKYPVLHHSTKIASYRIHDSNLSGDYSLMLNSALKVLERQKKNLYNKAERKAFKSGKRNWKEYYYPKIYHEVISKKNILCKEAILGIPKRYSELLYLKSFIIKSLLSMNIKLFIKKNAPKFMLRTLHKLGLYENFAPATGKINTGDLNRIKPFNKDFGYSRGGPVDRYYIENFLEEQAVRIKGRVLEIGDNEYTLRYGKSQVTKSEILHIDNKNPRATIIADLSDAPQLTNNTFDSIILTQTLHLIYPFKNALETCYRILKPGGTLLITVPGISHIDHHEWKDCWYWSFTDNSLRRLLSEIFSDGNVTVESYGNVLAATAFLFGVGLPEMKKEQMDFNDPHYQVIVTAIAVKPE